MYIGAYLCGRNVGGRNVESRFNTVEYEYRTLVWQAQFTMITDAGTYPIMLVGKLTIVVHEMRGA